MALADRLSELQVASSEDDAPLTSSDVAELERRLGSSLPADYLEFALAYGGCYLRGGGRVLLLNDSRTVPLDGFFGGQASSQSVLEMQEQYADAFPDGAVPIADDLLGNLYILWVTDPDMPGRIWYAEYSSGDRSTVRSDGTWPVPCHIAATSFTDLLCRTQPVEEV